MAMDAKTARVASRAMRYIACQGMDRDEALTRALADYVELAGAVDLEAVDSCMTATLGPVSDKGA
jgi:hypothetical protein